jgi:trk system potassium uptake protein TrkH
LRELIDMPSGHLPGNRVIRRRLRSTQIIPLPAPVERSQVLSPQDYARRFVAAFLALIAIGTLILSLPIANEGGQDVGWIDAMFTAVSALAVTGLVTVDSQAQWSFIGEVTILLLIQIGGLGFTVGASILLVTMGRGGKLGTALVAQDGAPTLPLSEVVTLSSRIVRFVLVTEAIGALVLTIRFLEDRSPLEALWFGVFHAVSAFCNAGFDLQGDYRSMTEYHASPWVGLTLMSLIQAGALSYIVLHDVWVRRRWRDLALDSKLILLGNALLLVLGAVVFVAVEWNAAMAGLSDWSKPLTGLFQSVSARTAGFATIDFGDARPVTLFLWIGLMMVGGASGSTAGGIKITTAVLIMVAIMATLRGHPETQVFGRRIPSAQIFLAMGIVFLFVFTHFMLTLCLVLTETAVGSGDFAFIDLMFETMSAAATVGLSTGITPEISGPGKLILCVAMFFGRLGPLTLAYALTRRQRPARYRFPETRVRLG